MKGKYKYTFANGQTMTDRNGYKTLKEAKAWAMAHNRATKANYRKIVKVETKK